MSDEIDLDVYRYDKGNYNSYSVLTMKNYTDRCSPELLSEKIGEYKDAKDMVNRIITKIQDYDVAKYYINKIDISFKGSNNNVVACNIILEGPVTSKAHIYLYYKIYTAGIDESEDIFRLLKIEASLSKTKDTIDTASASGDLVGVKHLIETGSKPTLRAINLASSNNHINVVKYLVDQGVKPNHETLVLAINNGATEVVEYLTSIGIKPTEKDVKSATGNGYITMAKYLGIAYLIGEGITMVYEVGHIRGHREGYKEGLTEIVRAYENASLLDVAKFAASQATSSIFNLFS